MWFEAHRRHQETLGYKPVLHRSYTLFENFATAFAALYFIGGVRVTFTTGIAAGGNLAYWSVHPLNQG